MSAFGVKRTSAVHFAGLGHQLAVRAARWALLLIVRTLSNDAITIAVWTGFGFHVCLPVDHSRA